MRDNVPSGAPKLRRATRFVQITLSRVLLRASQLTVAVDLYVCVRARARERERERERECVCVCVCVCVCARARATGYGPSFGARTRAYAIVSLIFLANQTRVSITRPGYAPEAPYARASTSAGLSLDFRDRFTRERAPGAQGDRSAGDDDEDNDW